MSHTTRILAFAGSTRTESYNKKLVRLGADLARAHGAEVTVADLRDFPMPLYDGDLESQEGLPESAKQFKELMKSHAGFLISSPEYNSSISGVLKNTIDWASREGEGETPLVCFKGKVAAIVSASPGKLGGLRGLVTVRSILGNVGVIVLPESLTLGSAHEAFDADGKLKDAHQHKALDRAAARLVDVTARLSAPR